MNGRFIVGLLPAGAVVWLLVNDPLPAWPLAAALIGYAALLVRYPAAFLVILPIVLPALDFGLWSGWVAFGEADPFVLTTLAVLLVRARLSWRDLAPRGPGAVALGALAAVWTLAAIIGLLSPLGAEPSDNPYLRPDNALRLAKSLAEALALMPFLVNRQRTHGDAVLRLGHGIAAGLAVVTLIVLAERLLYCGLLDFSGEYRVAGPFSSMHVGGGHIGAYTAMALPFALTLFSLRPRIVGVVLGIVGLFAGGYTLAATLARTAYAAGAAGMVGSGVAMLRGRRHAGAAPVGIAAMLAVVAALAAVTAFTGMRVRFAGTAGDFTTREGNWQAGLAVRDKGVVPALVGMGLGTYQRAMLVRSAVNKPSDLRVLRTGGTPAVELRVESPLFLGQKVSLPEGPVRVHLQAKAVDGPNSLGVVLCDKVLLYSDNCRGAGLALPSVGRWETLDATLPTAGLGARALGGVLHRLVEFSLSAPRGRVELRDVRLTGADGTALLANGDFAHGLDRWLFTDDSHVSWRILNVYLMLFFETGALGVAAYLALAGTAMVGALAGARSGVPGAAPVVGAVTAFLVSGLFDDVVEAPRLAALFFLVCIAGLAARPQAVRDAVPLTPTEG